MNLQDGLTIAVVKRPDMPYVFFGIRVRVPCSG